MNSLLFVEMFGVQMCFKGTLFSKQSVAKFLVASAQEICSPLYNGSLKALSEEFNEVQWLKRVKGHEFFKFLRQSYDKKPKRPQVAQVLMVTTSSLLASVPHIVETFFIHNFVAEFNRSVSTGFMANGRRPVLRRE